MVYPDGPAEEVAVVLADATLFAYAGSLLSTCEAVLHQLEHGEASEGDERDIAWCIRHLKEAIATATTPRPSTWVDDEIVALVPCACGSFALDGECPACGAEIQPASTPSNQEEGR
jgi:hypothetical protein